jgi:hypothetical protein
MCSCTGTWYMRGGICRSRRFFFPVGLEARFFAFFNRKMAVGLKNYLFFCPQRPEIAGVPTAQDTPHWFNATTAVAVMMCVMLPGTVPFGVQRNYTQPYRIPVPPCSAVGKFPSHSPTYLDLRSSVLLLLRMSWVSSSCSYYCYSRVQSSAPWPLSPPPPSL